ncbi:MAG: septum site-determining protein MinC [Paucibacter sp.]|nr:septum site-determining protein MinC [Roseateles sp.]
MAQASTARAARPAEGFDLKSASLNLLAFVPKSVELADIEAEFERRLGDTPDMFEHDPVLIDLAQLPRSSAEDEAGQGQLTLDQDAAQAALDLTALVALLRRHRMQPVALRGGNATERAQALAAGLALAPDDALEARAETRTVEVVREIVREVQVEVPVQVAAAAESPRTLVVDRPLRSGQQVYAKGADLVVLAAVNPGAEVIADGSIHVYAPLRGKAIAGARGNTEARIFAASLEAELIAIAGIYRTTENPLPAHVLGKAAQVRLDGEKLVMEALGI